MITIATQSFHYLAQGTFPDSTVTFIIEYNGQLSHLSFPLDFTYLEARLTLRLKILHFLAPNKVPATE